MAELFHLGSIHEIDRTIVFTLVVENLSSYLVESYNDARLSFLKDRFKRIKPEDFWKYQVNGIPLKQLVAEKLKELSKGLQR